MKIGRAAERAQAGLRLEAAGQPAKAEREYRAALDIAPREPTALTQLGLLLAARGEFEKCLILFRRAALADPKDAQSRLNMAAAYVNLGDEEAAGRAFEEALAADPTNRKARMNVAFRRRAVGHFDEARAHQEILLAQDPHDGVARWNLAALDGLEGRLDEAFAGFAHPETMKADDIPKTLPLWDGQPLEGRSILLECEQGLGDVLMFCRLIPRVRDLGGKVILRAPSAVRPLVGDFDGVARFAPRDKAVPPADVWYALADLPAIFGHEALAAARPPYLSAAPERAEAWARRLPPTERIRVGLVWAGGPDHAEDRERSMALATLLAPLRALEGFEWVSLQKGGPSAQADGTALTRADLDIADFQDTAAAIGRLDLVICVDTSVLHLAGALNHPVWGLIAFAPDWRWMLKREDSPWYPSLRLFRQTTPGDWPGVAARVAEALARFAEERRAGEALVRTGPES